jgi:hypothetical protein
LNEVDGGLIKKIAGMLTKKNLIQQNSIGGIKLRPYLIATKLNPQMAVNKTIIAKCCKLIAQDIS